MIGRITAVHYISVAELSKSYIIFITVMTKKNFHIVYLALHFNLPVSISKYSFIIKITLKSIKFVSSYIIKIYSILKIH